MDANDQAVENQGAGDVRLDLTFDAETRLPYEPAHVFAWHERAGALARLMPPWEPAEVLSQRGTIHDGDETTLRVHGGPLRFEWRARHFGFEQGVCFNDEQLQGPFAAWTHEHRFVAADGLTRAIDHITYRVPGGGVGEAFGRPSVEKKLHRLFAHRYAALAGDLSRHAAYTGPPLRILVAGGSGLVGRALCAFLSTGGHEVVRLVRASSAAAPDAVGKAVAWDPYAGSVNVEELGRIDAVVNLAGENVADGRWTPDRKHKLQASRVTVTRFLAGLAAQLSPRPSVFINASAMGFYGERGDQAVDEAAARGEGFLADLCEAWEGATQPASLAGIRVVLPRISLVLTPQEGLLAKMLPAFRAGVGGRLGTGKQWMSWIALDDLVGLIHQALYDERFRGPINACTPEPLRNSTFTQKMGKALGRPTFLPVPTLALKLALGEMGQVATSSTKMAAAKLQQLGFRYRLPTLDAALSYLLGLQPLPALDRGPRSAHARYVVSTS